MNLEHGARSIGSLRVARNERRPTPHTHFDRLVRLVLDVSDRVVTPIVRGLNQAHFQHLQVDPERRPVIPGIIFRLARGERRSLAADADPQIGCIQRTANRREVVEDGAVAEHAGRFEVQRAGVDSAQRHSGSGPRPVNVGRKIGNTVRAIADPRDGFGVPCRLKTAPLRVLQVCRKQPAKLFWFTRRRGCIRTSESGEALQSSPTQGGDPGGNLQEGAP